MYLNLQKKWMIDFITIALIMRSLLPGFIPYTFSFTLTHVTLVVALMTVFVYYRRSVFNWRIVPVIALFLVFCDNNYYYKGGTINFYIYGIVLLMMVFAISGEGEWITLYLRGATLMGLVHAFATIAFKFLPGVYLGVVAPLYPDTYSRLVGWYSEGCMAGLAGHYSTNGMYLVVGLYASVGLIFLTKDASLCKRMAPSAIIMIAILLTGKRSHLFFSIIVLYGLYYFYLSNDKKTRSVRMIGMALIALFVGFIIILYVPSLGNAFSRFKESADRGDITNNRIYFWGLALQLFIEKPVFGVGWGRFQEYCEAMLNYRAHAHNTFLQLLCETGVIGSLVYIIWMVTILIVCVRMFVKVRTTTNDPKQLGMLAFSVQMQLFFFLYCFTGNPLYEKEMFIPYFIACAVALYEDYLLRKTKVLA